MEKKTKEIFIGVMIALVVTLFVFNSTIYIMSIEGEDVEHSGIITMKWKVDKLILDWYRFEIDNDTILDVDSEYTWYKYNEGDIYTWNESEYTYPNWWLLW